jgi:hypothetical protein
MNHIVILGLTFIVQQPQYTFHEDTSREVAMYRGNTILIGRLDKHGELQIESKTFKDSITTPQFRNIAINLPTNGKKVYELRSGRLIKGEITEDGSFIPDLGTKVIDFKDYKYTPDGIQIYNLPGHYQWTGNK